MERRRNRTRVNVEGDRLSSLPDDLIHKILSFISINEAIETSALSSRWRYIWTSLPYLNFSSEGFNTLPEFSKFVTHVLSRLNDEIDVSSLTLTFHEKISQVAVKKILNYAFSHNIQQLNVKYVSAKKKKIVFPLSLFRSHSLKHLTLFGCRYSYRCPITLTSTWQLPSLTTLHLYKVTFDDDECSGQLSKCVNLKNLTLERCTKTGSNGFKICHPRLCNLTIEGGLARDLDVPQLENLSIRGAFGKYLISAPHLVSLLIKGNPSQISTDGFPVLEKADICFSYPKEEFANNIVCLLQLLHNVKFLILNLEIVEVLSSSVELISHQSSPFAYLKTLKIYPDFIYNKNVGMSTEVKNYLLDASPNVTFTMVSREEIIAVNDATLAQNLMKSLGVLLKLEKANIETNMAKMHKEGNAQIEESAQLKTKKQRDFEGRMSEIECCWKDLRVKLDEWDAKKSNIITKLRRIEEILTKLPTSQRAKMQPKFSSLCVEADTITKNMMYCMKIQCDKEAKPF